MAMPPPPYKELTLSEALELTNNAIVDLHANLAQLAFDHAPSTQPEISSEEVADALQRRENNLAAFDRMRTVLLEIISREFVIVEDDVADRA